MNTSIYNMSLATDYVAKNFWKNVDDSLSAKEVKALYENFLKEHENEVLESVNELYSQKIKGRQINEGFWDDDDDDDETPSTPKKYDDVPTEDDIPDEEPQQQVKAPSKKVVKVSQSKSSSAYANSLNPTVHNRGKSAYLNQDETDINYLCDLIYNDIEQGKVTKKDGSSATLYDKTLPYTIMNVSDVTDFTAVFAFKDLPNVDLSLWNVENGTTFEGMFYKSTFNNDSIIDWKLKKARNVKNMFIASEFSKKNVIDRWATTINPELGYLPVIGEYETDNGTEDVSASTRSRFNNYEENAERLKEYNKRLDMEQNDDQPYESKKYVMSSSDFIAEMYGVNEGIIGDFAKKSFKKIKGALETVGIKMKNGFVFIIDKMMAALGANFPQNIVNFIKNGNVKGVYAERGEALNYPEKDGYYGSIKEGSKEFNNYIKFMSYLPKSKSVKESVEVNERRVGLRAEDEDRGNKYVNIDCEDIDTKELEGFLNDALNDIRVHGAAPSEPLIIWGAPGIGKTTIPKTIIREINKKITKEGGKDGDKMSLIVVDCSTLQAGDLSMPMPVKIDDLTIAELKQIPAIKNMMEQAKKEGHPMTDDDLMKYATAKSADAPKTWLPAYLPSADEKVNQVKNDTVNGHVNEIFDDHNVLVASEWRGGGGILMFDEFLRCDPDTLFGIANLMYQRMTSSGYKLGSKWYVMGCSNRPDDDAEIAKNWDNTPPALTDRTGHYNFVPDFKDWCKWAKEEGGFDDFTLNFIAKTDPYGNNSRWHNIDPEALRGNRGVRKVTPRSWSASIAALNRECERKGVKTYPELGERLFYLIVARYLPSKISKEYVDDYIDSNGLIADFTYEDIMADPTMEVTGMNAIAITNIIQREVSRKYSVKDPIPPQELKNIIIFLETNTSDLTGNAIETCIAKIAAYCDLTGENYKDSQGNYTHGDDSKEWHRILKNFAKDHPNIADTMQTQKKGVMY